MIAADGDGGASPFSDGGQVYRQGTYSGRRRMLTGNDNINSMLLSCAGNSADGTCDGSCQPTCSCQALAAPIGGSIEYTGGHPLCGSQVAAYSCAAGPLQGGDASRACGAFGAWSGTAPTHCGCPSLPAVAGMSIARSSGDAVGSVAVRPTKPLSQVSPNPCRSKLTELWARAADLQLRHGLDAAGRRRDAHVPGERQLDRQRAHVLWVRRADQAAERNHAHLQQRVRSSHRHRCFRRGLRALLQARVPDDGFVHTGCGGRACAVPQLVHEPLRHPLRVVQQRRLRWRRGRQR